MEQTLSNEVVEYIRNRKTDQKRGVAFSFWYRPDSVDIQTREKNKAQAEIRYYDGSWHTETGKPVKPVNASKWHKALVNVSLPTTTTLATVRIRGIKNTDGGFQARIDLASLSVYYYDTSIDGYGNATLVTSIYCSKAISHPEWDGFSSYLNI